MVIEYIQIFGFLEVEGYRIFKSREYIFVGGRMRISKFLYSIFRTSGTQLKVEFEKK